LRISAIKTDEDTGTSSARNTYFDNIGLQGGPKTDTQFYFWDNFGNSALILTIHSLLQAEI